MIEKRKLSFWVYLVVLCVILILSYYLSGLFLFGDLSFINLREHLSYIFRHPMQNWWNAKSPACLSIGLLVWILFAMYLQNHYRNFHSGAEYGTEEWADVRALNKKMRDKNPAKNRILSRHLSITREGNAKLSNNNMLVIGSSGTYKTNSVVTPNLLQASCNYVVLDVKGELMYKYGRYLQSRGYTIRCLNLKEPDYSDRYNPFLYLEKEEDVIRLIANIQEALTPPDAQRGDPFWQDGACLYLQSVFFYEWHMAKKEGRPGSMNNIMGLINDEATLDPEVDVGEGEEPPTLLQSKMNRLAEEDGPENPAVRDYRKLKRGAEETVRSIIIIVNATLKLMETESLRRLFSGDDLQLREFATGVEGTVDHPTDKKIALFLCVPDSDKSYNFICSMVYTQALDILMRMADTDFRDRGGALPIPIEFWLDEFYAGARPYGTESLMGVVRSRNISLIPILQSVAQIKALFPGDKWQIIMDNCAVLMYLGSGSGALETHKYISELIGKMTIDTASDGQSGKSGSVNYNRTGRELMTPAEVRRMDRKDCIIFMEGQLPILDQKALPWEMPEKEVPYKKALHLNREGGYIHPVTVVKDPDGHTHTIREDTIPPAVLEFTNGSALPYQVMINLSEEDFLYMNLHPDAQSGIKRNVPTGGTYLNEISEKSLEEYILEFSMEASREEMDQIINALEEGKGITWVQEFIKVRKKRFV